MHKEHDFVLLTEILIGQQNYFVDIRPTKQFC